VSAFSCIVCDFSCMCHMTSHDSCVTPCWCLLLPSMVYARVCSCVAYEEEDTCAYACCMLVSVHVLHMRRRIHVSYALCMLESAPTKHTLHRVWSTTRHDAAWIKPPDKCSVVATTRHMPWGTRPHFAFVCVCVRARVCVFCVCVFFFVCAGRSRRVSGHEGRYAGTQHKGSPAPALRRGRLAQGALVFSSTHY
jgi:hypothetical protein